MSNKYVHYEGIISYRNDYSKFFTGGNHYILIGKKHFSHQNDSFDKELNERISSALLFKEYTESIY